MTSISPSQEARDAAAAWAKLNGRNAQAANIKRGSRDTAPIVQAFATFEAQIEARRTPPSDELRERVLQEAFKALRNYRMGNMAEEDDHLSPYPLVDLCTRPDCDISDGEEQIGEMAADVADSIIALLPGGSGLCEDCPPAGYPTDKTRCTPCPRRSAVDPDLVERLRKLLEEATLPVPNTGDGWMDRLKVADAARQQLCDYEAYLPALLDAIEGKK